MKTPQQILNEAASIVERGHTKGAYARDAQGNVVRINSPNAARFCAEGALLVTCETVTQYLAAKDMLRAHLGRRDVSKWNDEYSGAVVALRMREAAKHE